MCLLCVSVRANMLLISKHKEARGGHQKSYYIILVQCYSYKQFVGYMSDIMHIQYLALSLYSQSLKRFHKNTMVNSLTHIFFQKLDFSNSLKWTMHESSVLSIRGS